MIKNNSQTKNKINIYNCNKNNNNNKILHLFKIVKINREIQIIP